MNLKNIKEIRLHSFEGNTHLIRRLIHRGINEWEELYEEENKPCCSICEDNNHTEIECDFEVRFLQDLEVEHLLLANNDLDIVL